MAVTKFLPTLADLANCEWEKIILSADKKMCDNYCKLLFDKAQMFEQDNDERCANLLFMLANITSMYLKPDDISHPLASAWHSGDTRSANLGDIDDRELDFLEEIVSKLHDAELQARIADILWIKRQEYRWAQIAIRAYLESVRYLESLSGDAIFLNRLHRACAIAIQLGKKNSEISDVMAYIETLISKYTIADSKFLHASLMQLLLRYRLGEPACFIPLSKQAAELAEKESDWHRARVYWELCALWSKRAVDLSTEKFARLRSAESIVQQAENAIRRVPQSYASAAAILREAIEAFRLIGNQKDRIVELHHKLLNYEQMSLREFGEFHSELDFTLIAQQARDQVKGLPLADALVNLAKITTLHSIVDMRSQVEEIMAQMPLISLFSSNVYNADGKLVGKRPSYRADEPEHYEKAIRFEMIRYCAQLQSSAAIAIIEPARQQILSENASTTAHIFVSTLSDNVFVPVERIQIYANGLLDGLRGDFSTAIHLLIPQLENSFRHILRQQGVIVSSLDQAGIQDEFDLNTVLAMTELKQILGDDLIFDLRALLTEKIGTNLRNLMAHGLLDFPTAFAPPCCYAWWLTWSLCFMFKKWSDDRQSTEQEH
jgi:hypothetical protein